jgi:hypothetical protein
MPFILQTFGSGLDVSKYTPEGQTFDITKVSIAFLAEYYKINPDSLIYREGYEDQDVGVKHAWVDQTFVCSLPFIPSGVVIHTTIGWY